MALNDFGFAISFGTLRGLQTDGQNLTTPESWALGDILYASAAVAGELTRTPPAAPNQAVPIAFITSVNSSAGALVVRAYELGSHLDEIHDVEITSVADNDILQWSSANSRWENITTPTFSDTEVQGTLDVTGQSTLSGLAYPTSDGTSGQFLKTDGSGNLAFATVPTTLSVIARSGAVDIAITNGFFTVVGRSANVSIGVS